VHTQGLGRHHGRHGARARPGRHTLIRPQNITASTLRIRWPTASALAREIAWGRRPSCAISATPPLLTDEVYPHRHRQPAGPQRPQRQSATIHLGGREARRTPISAHESGRVFDAGLKRIEDETRIRPKHPSLPLSTRNSPTMPPENARMITLVDHRGGRDRQCESWQARSPRCTPHTIARDFAGGRSTPPPGSA